MAEKETLIPKVASAESLSDPLFVQQSPPETQSLISSASTSALVSESCYEPSIPGPSSMPSTSQGTGSQLVSSSPVTHESRGSLTEIPEIPTSPEKGKDVFICFFKSFVKEGSDPSVPIQVIGPPISAFEIALGYLKDFWLSGYVLVMLIIIGFQAVLILLCCAGYSHIFNILLLVLAYLILAAMLGLIGVVAVMTYRDLKSGKRIEVVKLHTNTYYKISQLKSLQDLTKSMEEGTSTEAKRSQDSETAQCRHRNRSGEEEPVA